jgi:hypothetical protein
MKKLFSAVLSMVVVVFCSVSADAGFKGGGFRSFKAPTFRSVPSIKPSSPSSSWFKSTPKPSAPAYKPTYKVPAYKPSTANSYSSWRAGTSSQERLYRSYGFQPSVRQSSLFDNPWFWMYMFNSHSSTGTEVVTAPAVQTQQSFKERCLAAVNASDKPSGFDLKAEECDGVAQQASAKVKADDAFSTGIDPNDPLSGDVSEPKRGIPWWMWITFGGFLLMGISLILGYSSSKRY